MIVYGHPLSSCTRKVLVTLAEKNTPAELRSVDLFTGEHKKEAWLARHPFGVIPVLDDDGFVLLESRAILRYLDRRLDGAPLSPSSVRDLARMDQWLSIDQSYVAPHTRSLAIERVVKKHAGTAPDPAAEAAAEASLGTAFDVFDRALADISLLPYIGSLSMIGAGHLLDGRPHLQRWWEAARSRPSWTHVAG